MKPHAISWLNVPGYKPETWNPIVGCSHASPGCDHCYAERDANSGRLQQFERYQEVITAGKWNGRTVLHEPTLLKPLRWSKPRAIFVGSMTDLFHDATPREWIDQVLAIAALCPQHIFIVLTKRAKAMHTYLSRSEAHFMAAWGNCATQLLGSRSAAAPRKPRAWPLPNLWLGVTAENQPAAKQRIPLLLDTPAAVRFISAEPLLGPLNLPYAAYTGAESFQACGQLDWVIAGGESGPGARALSADWLRYLRADCITARIPFFFKQWGSNRGTAHECDGYSALRNGGDILDGQQHHAWPAAPRADATADYHT